LTYLFRYTLMINLCFHQLFADAPVYKGIYFQDPATSLTEELILFHDKILFFIIITTFFVCRALLDILINKTSLSFRNLHHHSTLEVVRTLIPSFILLCIAIPSFKLLYLMDEIIDPSLTVKATSWQWYWNYEYSDLQEGSLAFDSYCVLDEDLDFGNLRLLEVDNPLVLPVNTHVRVIVTSGDVIHCFAVPSLGARTDAIPGRLNSLSFVIKRTGLFRGICAELCGTNHFQMPIVIKSVNLEEFMNWLNKEQNN
jgi:cytochrome c oxidase subunit 2